MKRYTIGCGIGYDKDHEPLDPGHVARYKSILLHKIPRHFGGVTIRDTVGGWVDKDHQVFIETGWSIEILASADDEREIRALAESIKTNLMQASVVFIVEDVNASFL